MIKVTKKAKEQILKAIGLLHMCSNEVLESRAKLAYNNAEHCPHCAALSAIISNMILSASRPGDNFTDQQKGGVKMKYKTKPTGKRK